MHYFAINLKTHQELGDLPPDPFRLPGYRYLRQMGGFTSRPPDDNENVQRPHSQVPLRLNISD